MSLAAHGYRLPAPMLLPADVTLPFPWVRVYGNRAFLSGHGPLAIDGALAQPLGKVGREVSPDQAYHAAELTALAMIASLVQAGVELDRVTWMRAFGMVNAVPGFIAFPQVINGFTDTILKVFGSKRGSHARSAVGMSALPFNVPVEIEAELELG